MNFSRYEQETIISFDEEYPTAHIFTFNRKTQKRILDIIKDYPDRARLINEHENGAMVFDVDKKLVIPCVRKPRNISDEQRAAASQRFKKVKQKNDVDENS